MDFERVTTYYRIFEVEFVALIYVKFAHILESAANFSQAVILFREFHSRVHSHSPGIQTVSESPSDTGEPGGYASPTSASVLN
jgi:hypothetical protein